MTKESQLPDLFSAFRNASTLDTGGKSLLDFYFSAAGLVQRMPTGPSGLPSNAHYIYMTTKPQAEAQYKKKSVVAKHREVKLMALEQLRVCVPQFGSF